jgi:hypothetical protein
LTPDSQQLQQRQARWYDRCNAAKSMMVIARALTLVLLIAISFSAHTAVYYVSTTGNDKSGNGSIEKPWRTIGHGMLGMSGGDTLYIRGGVYEEPGIQATSASRLPSGLSSEQRTRIVGYPGESVEFRPTSGASGGAGVYVVTKQNLSFESFTINGILNADGGPTLYFRGCTNVMVTNMTLLNVAHQNGINFFEWQDARHQHSYVVSCVISNWASKYDSSVTDDHKWGIYARRGDNMIIRDNVIIGPTPFARKGGGIVMSSGENNLMERNYVKVSGGSTGGGYFASTRSLTNSVIRNNIGLSPDRGFIISGCENTSWDNNTIYGNGDRSLNIGSEPIHNAVFRNNIFWGYDRLAFVSSEQQGTLFFTNNIASGIIRADRTTVVEVGTIQHDPLFVNPPDNFTTAISSPARGAGINLSHCFQTDHDGLKRAQSGPWDIGAFEHGEQVIIDMMATMGKVEWPMTITGGEVLATQELNRSVAQAYVLSPVAGSGSVEFEFEVPAAGEYVVWCQMLAPSGYTDSVYVSVNNEKPDLYYPTEGADPYTWSWSRVNGVDTGLPYGLRMFQLQAGVNRLRFSTTHPYVGLSRVMVTDDLDFVPEAEARSTRQAPQVAIERNGRGTVLRWPAMPDKNYHVFYKEDLRDPHWMRPTPLSALRADSTAIEWTDQDATSARFYLVYAAP